MNFIAARKGEIFRITILLMIALCSIFIVSNIATNPETYRSTIQSIDEKKATVMSVTAGAAATSAILAVVPGDVTTPIANQIMQISSYLLIVVCVLALEKSLLTVMGYVSFSILIPIACGLLGIHTFCKRENLKMIALKLVAFAIVIMAIVPVSLKIGDMICDLHATEIEQVVENAEVSEVYAEDENTSWVDHVVGRVKNGVANASNYAKQKLNQFIDAIAVFLISYCVIPVLVLIVFAWIVKLLFGINIPRESERKNRRGKSARDLS